MTNIIEMLKERKDYLEKIIEERASLEEQTSKKQSSKDQNNHSITAIKHGKGFQYYKYNGKEKKYVPVNEIENVRKIVQREYDTKLLRATKAEYKRISRLLNNYEKITLDGIYESMPLGKRILVKPVLLPEEEFIKQWKEEEYQSLGFREDAPSIIQQRASECVRNQK